MRIQNGRWIISVKKSNGEANTRQIVFALCCILFLPAINNFINSFLQIGLSIYLEFVTPMVYIFMACVSALFLYKHFFRRKNFAVIFLLFFGGAIVSYVLYPEIRTVIYTSPIDLVYSPINKLFFFCIPAFIGSRCLTDYKWLFYKMSQWARCSVIIGILTYLFVILIKGARLPYMSFSYFMLLPICVCFESKRTNKLNIDFVLAIMGTICIVLCGARGAVMSLILYFMFRIFDSDIKKVNVKKVLHFFVLLVIAVIFILTYEEILLSIVSLLDKFGIDSRFISYLFQGALLEDSGRNLLTTAVISGVKDNPFGYGLYGDRYVTGHFGVGKYRYSHNIFLEVICDFGIVGGVVLILLLIWKLGKMWFVFKRNKEVRILLSLFPFGLFQLLFSSSFLENVGFFIVLGLIFVRDSYDSSRRCGDTR